MKQVVVKVHCVINDNFKHTLYNIFEQAVGPRVLQTFHTWYYKTFIKYFGQHIINNTGSPAIFIDVLAHIEQCQRVTTLN